MRDDHDDGDLRLRDGPVNWRIALQRSSSSFKQCAESSKGLLTRLDGGQSREKRNRVHDALFSFKSTRFQDPCCDWVDDKDVKEETR